ncbi:metal transporter [Alteribacter lacisalsi]|uniref:Metal transporter n=1 Tax=Alteribacter lacisalsi TaxID=2045244 RepID=A0A2W0HA49_9BACI|nr:potassium channel family protein [Alteribacter lacisalsi]PYZ97781.1 metal transporter [Alteribacter lacisalsi]
MIAQLLIGMTVIFVIVNLYYFFSNRSYRHTWISSALFFKLTLILISLTFSFAAIYYLMSLEQVVLRINDPTGEPVEGTFMEYLYYSGVTLLSIGYGDMVPVGPARFISVVQAGLGVLLPAAYFLKAFGNTSSKESKT